MKKDERCPISLLKFSIDFFVDFSATLKSTLDADFRERGKKHENKVEFKIKKFFPRENTCNIFQNFSFFYGFRKRCF